MTQTKPSFAKPPSAPVIATGTQEVDPYARIAALIRGAGERLRQQLKITIPISKGP
jgi:hypothetical protein